MNINNINRSSGISHIGGATIASSSQINRHYEFKEQFNFNLLELNKQYSTVNDDLLILKKIIKCLFYEILASGANILVRPGLSNGESVIEASFKPAIGYNQPAQFFLPLRGMKNNLLASEYNFHINSERLANDVALAVEQIFNATNCQTILKLVLLIAHEYGHFISSLRNFHDNELKVGLGILHSQRPSFETNKYCYAVFREEVTAWRFAEVKLKKLYFKDWQAFNCLKMASLKEYYRILNLAKIGSIDTFAKISMLGIDLSALI